MLHHHTYTTMERDELVRLAGEQALLSKELTQLRAEQTRDVTALRNLANDIGSKTDWHTRGTQLLDRLQEREKTLATGGERLRQLAMQTGL